MPAGRIIALSSGMPALSPASRREIERAYVDTLAVLHAGWNEPVTLALRKTYGVICPPWDPGSVTDIEATALTWGTAAHVLDYDDVHMTSVTHPSAVLIPAIEAVSSATPDCASRRAEAFAVGLAVNVALGNAMGFAHYARGWHATSTIGSVAAGAAIAHLLGLREGAFRSALAIAAAQAGGLQRNFGTMVKPLQAGIAAAAGVRAARLAAAGIDGPHDVFSGSNGYLAAFEGDPAVVPDFDVEAASAGLSRKLFACCYMAHRPVAAAIALHRQGAASLAEDPDIRVEVEVPPGCLKALTVDIPSTGAEAKFSGRYTVARALRDGDLGLAAFETKNVGGADIVDLARRVFLAESAAVGNGEVGINRGMVTVSLVRDREKVASTAITHYPGSPESPITEAELDAKVADCLVAGGGGGPGRAEQFRRMARQFAGII